MTAMQAVSFHRLCQVSGIASAIVLALLLIGTTAGRNTLAWIYLHSAEITAGATHIRTFSLDRFDPTCPQCM
jgi:hypothetical protein